MTTRMQHYVWRKYLEAWQDGSEQICCSRKGVFFKTNPANIMKKRDYYSLSRITRTDMVFLDAMFRKTNPELRKAHQNLIGLFGYIAHANHVIQASGKASEEERKYVHDLVIEAEEKLQTGIEQQALPILEQLRHEKADFLCDYDVAMSFFRFVSHQYLRTRALRDRIGEELQDSLCGRDFGHLKNLISHCAAENLGASLFVDRNEFEILFLRNGPDYEFITGDQPIVNLFPANDEDSPPTDLVLYYPLKPHISMVLVPKMYGLTSMEVPPNLAGVLNNLIALKSREFLVAKRMDSLQDTNWDLQGSHQQDGHILIEQMKNVAAG